MYSPKKPEIPIFILTNFVFSSIRRRRRRKIRVNQCLLINMLIPFFVLMYCTVYSTSTVRSEMEQNSDSDGDSGSDSVVLQLMCLIH